MSIYLFTDGYYQDFSGREEKGPILDENVCVNSYFGEILHMIGKIS